MSPSQMLRLVLLFLCLNHLKAAPIDDKEERFALHYLKEFGYLSPLRNGNHNIKDAVRIFQQRSDIPDTGTLDAATLTEMHKPRCGVPDFDEEELSHSGRQKRFSVAATSWTKLQLTYRFLNYATKGGLTHDQQRKILQRAFNMWQAIGPLSMSFTDVTGLSSTADITLSFKAKGHHPCPLPFDGPGLTLAHAFSPQSGVVHFDDDETFTDGTPSGTNLFSVALHEIGHILGLKHSINKSAIMHDIHKTYNPNMKLTDDDKHGMDYIYAQGSVAPDSTPSPCEDTTTDCSKYGSYCQDEFFGDTTRKICPKTCNQCGGQNVNAPDCKDVLIADYCNAYAKNSFCIQNPPIKYVIENCRKTCNMCNTV